MNPTRFDNEVDYYDILLQNYLKYRKDSSNEKVKFEMSEIIQLMTELNQNEFQDLNEKSIMENIVKNMLVLLLSLFEGKDQTVDYKDYNDLTMDEKSLLKKQLLPVFTEN